MRTKRQPRERPREGANFACAGALAPAGTVERRLAENDRYPPIELAPGVELQVWGVVTSVVHSL